MSIIETKFSYEIKSCEYNLWDEEETKEHVDNCIKIGDNHAIKFAEYMSTLIFKNYKSGGYWFVKGEIKTTKQLLEIFNSEY